MENRPALILLIEDDETHAMLTSRAFEDVEIKHEIRWVCSGDEAMDYLFRRGKFTDPKDSPRPDLILLDLRIPVVDGHEILKAVKESDDLKPLPVVILTTSQNRADMDRAYSNHANSYLVKPMGSDKFREMIDALGTYWLKWNQRMG
ncbi:MAG TPA: response regulator [Methanotrichaceae archaeon]|nr:response regulator [Methanotrichaceae archaeon]